MDARLLFAIGLSLVIGLALIILFLIIRHIWQGRTRSAAPPPDPQPRLLDATTSEQDGKTVAAVPDTIVAEPPPATGWWQRATRRVSDSFARYRYRDDQAGNAGSQRNRRGIVQVLAFLGLAVLLSIAMLLLPRFFPYRPDEQFAVVIAPFADSSDGQGGRLVAAELVRMLRERTNGQMVIEEAQSAPRSEAEALDMAINQKADVLIWGEVQPGGLPNTPTLLPRLIYTPQGAYAPDAWMGYRGRFQLPPSYTLSDEPINGEVVLPDLLIALANLSAGQFDESFEQLGVLLEQYPLNATLPRVLRANVLWARGDYEQAAGEYRRALAQPNSAQALLANNLGAILLDAGDINGATTALGETVQLLGGNDMGELRFNLGLLFLQQDRPANAVTELEQARNLLPANTALLLALADAYRENGQHGTAATTLRTAEQQLGAERVTVPAAMRSMVEQHLRAALAEQQGALALAEAVQARGPLNWELEVTPLQEPGTFSRASNALRQAITTSEALISAWRSRSAAEAAGVGTGLVAIGQTQQAEYNLNRQRYYLALALIEEGRSTLDRAPNPLAGIMDALFGTGTPLSESQTILNTLLILEPANVNYLIANGRALRLRGENDRANQTYDRLLSLDPNQPTGYYGKALLALNTGDRAAARQLLLQAIERDTAFFPARLTLAQIAEQDGDWPTALDNLHAVAQTYPNHAASRVALAAALRRSGASGYAEAEAELQPLVNAGFVPAMIELGQLYQDTGKLDAAAQTLEQARRADARSSVAAFELGQVRLALGDAPAAERQFRDAISNDRSNVAAYLALADLYQNQLNNPSAATDQYQRVLAINDLNANQLGQIGSGLLANGQARPAADAFNRAISQLPDDPRLYHELAQAYLALNNLDGASNAEQRVLELTANLNTTEAQQLRVDALIGLGDVERLRQRFPQAIDRYNQALGLDPNRIAAVIGLGQVAVGQDQWGVALGHFERAANLPGGAENADAQFWLAEALLRQPSPQRASEIYMQALNLRPNFPEAWLGLAQARYTLAGNSAAAETVDEALKLRPRYAEALLFKGKLLQEQGRLNEARDAYNTSIAINGRLPETFYRRALIAMQELDYDRAVGDLRRVTELQPNFAEAYYWLGRAYFAQERMTQALDSFQRAIALQGGSYTEARLYQGLVEEAMGRLQDATTSFQTVIQSDPLSDWANRARLELEQLGQSASR